MILVGEMRDLETIEIAMTAAETGHLVLSTLHTLDAVETVNRIVSVYPPHQQAPGAAAAGRRAEGGDVAAAGTARRRQGHDPGGRDPGRTRRGCAS